MMLCLRLCCNNKAAPSSLEHFLLIAQISTKRRKNIIKRHVSDRLEGYKAYVMFLAAAVGKLQCLQSRLVLLLPAIERPTDSSTSDFVCLMRIDTYIHLWSVSLLLNRDLISCDILPSQPTILGGARIHLQRKNIVCLPAANISGPERCFLSYSMVSF